MMAIDSRQIETGEPIDLSRCYDASDRAIEKNRIQRKMLCESAIRVSADSPWFALRVMPGRELAVEKALKDAGVEALVPMRLGPQLRRRHRVIPPSYLPVVLGYVMVRCCRNNEALAGILTVDDVLGLVGGDDNPHPIADKELSKFNEKALAGHFDWERPAGLFTIGSKVVVKEGPFIGFSGVIVSCRNDAKSETKGEAKGDAVVEFSKFGRIIPMILPIAILDPL